MFEPRDWHDVCLFFFFFGYPIILSIWYMMEFVLRWEISVEDVYTEEVKSIDVNYTCMWNLVCWDFEQWFWWGLLVVFRHCNEILISTRQKQYFEQRKRQQQNVQITGSDNRAESSGIGGQIHKEHQSLDILNLLNLSKNAQECNSFSQNGKSLLFFLHSSFLLLL
jgi:hypothetical protein